MGRSGKRGGKPQRPPGRPGGGSFATSRRDSVYVAFVALVGLAFAVVNALTAADDLRNVGRPVPFWEPAVWEVSSVVVLVAITPAVMAFTRRLHPFDAPWPRVIGGHILGAILFSAVHVAAMGALRWGAYALVGGDYPPLAPLANFPYELRKDLLTYAVLVGAYAGWQRLSVPAAGRAAPEAPAIEIRDGPRRRFVPLAEIAWIEAAGNYVELHQGGTPVLHRAPLSQMERELQGRGFVRIHRSRLVRRDAIAEVESRSSGDYVVRLVDGRELSGSRRFRRPLLQR